METEFMDINLHNLSEIYYLIFLVTTFHCRYCTFCGISFKSKEGSWKHVEKSLYFMKIKKQKMPVFWTAAEGFKLKILYFPIK